MSEYPGCIHDTVPCRGCGIICGRTPGVDTPLDTYTYSEETETRAAITVPKQEEDQPLHPCVACEVSQECWDANEPPCTAITGEEGE